MFTFAPTIIRGSTFFELPRPIVSLRLSDAWDFQRFKVPLRDGDTITGHSRNGSEIRLEGQIGSHAGQIQPDEAAMFATMEALRGSLHVASPADVFILSLYHDELGQHHYFQDCTTTRLELDLSEKHLFNFSVQIHAANPSLQTGVLS